MQISTNGIISAGTEEIRFVPRTLPTTGRLIAPLWGDADTRDGVGEITYGTNTDSATLTMIQQSIAAAFPDQSAFSPIYAFITTWNGVGYFNRHTDLVSFCGQ